MRCLCGCPIYPWNNHQSEVSCPTNVTPPPASLWWALKCCPHGADVSPTVWRPFLPIEVLSQITSILTSFTASQDFIMNDLPCSKLSRPEEDSSRGRVPWVSVQDRLVKKWRIATATLDHCHLWSMLMLVHMFNITQRRSWVLRKWADQRHVVVKALMSINGERE